MNNVTTLVGNVAHDPNLMNSGDTPMLAFDLAVTRRWLNKRTQRQEEDTNFVHVVAWSDLAENAFDSIQKGMRVIVVGRLEQRHVETRNGERYSKLQVSADEISPSLHRATAHVTRLSRDDAHNHSSWGSGCA